jgi:Cof subfamily protein (haloacid dehalogenase superfamily)
VPALDLTVTTAVVLDVDGTIAGPDNAVSPRTRAVMRAIEERGVPVVLATGRTRANVVDLARGTGLATPVVTCNGALVTDPRSGDDLRVRTMDPDQVLAMRRVHEETGVAFTWWTAQDVFATSEPFREVLLGFGATEVHLGEPPARMPDDVVKTMVFGSPDEMDAIAPLLQRRTPGATRSMDEIWELSDPEATKWAGISLVFDMLGVDPAGAVGLGDGENDVSWMERIGTPVAMGNARPEAKAVARAVVGHFAEEGAAVFLEEVLDQLGRDLAPPPGCRAGS